MRENQRDLMANGAQADKHMQEVSKGTKDVHSHVCQEEGGQSLRCCGLKRATWVVMNLKPAGTR